MPRYPTPYGYQIPRDSFEAPPMESVNRSQRKNAYAAQLRDQFDGVLTTAISMWGIEYVAERFRLAVGRAKAAR